MDIEFRTRELPEYKVRAKEVVKVFNDRPHLLVRVEVTGEYFPQRAPHPFIRIKIGRNSFFKDLFTEISPDNRKLFGYLPVDVPPSGVIEFGYDDEIWGVVPLEFNAESVERLDKEKLSEEVVVVNSDFVKRMNEKMDIG